MKAAMSGQGVARQALLIPDIVDLGETDAARVLARADELAEMGLVIEPFGTGAVAVRETPALLGEMNIQSRRNERAFAGHGSHTAFRAMQSRQADLCGVEACGY